MGSLSDVSPPHTSDVLVDASGIASTWLADFAAAIAAGHPADVVALFRADGCWRDIVALTGSVRSFGDLAGVTEAARRCVAAVDPASIRIRADWPPAPVTRAGRQVIEVLFEFGLDIGTGEGVVRLIVDAFDGVPRARAWTMMTSLRRLAAVPERVGRDRYRDDDFARHFGTPNWLDERRAEVGYAGRDPEVLVVGAGQAGLALGARLRALGIDTLIVERAQRVGDNWRDRYHSLTLHNEVDANHLPYLPFPETCPTYLPKDKMASWLEGYVDAMDLNVWTGTAFDGADFDDLTGRWTARVIRDGRGTKRLHPQHIVIATGVSGAPRIPAIPGLAGFGGRVMHSSEFVDAAEFRGERAVVLGVGNSGSDIAQDLHAHGCEVTMVQRGSITVVSQNPAARVLYAMYQRGLPLEIADLINVGSPFPAAYEGYQVLTAEIAALDRALIAGLNRVGFKTDYGENDTGFALRYLQTGGGHYLNVGCSELLIERKISLVQWDDVETVVANGLRLRSGDLVPASLLVLATGFHDLSARLTNYFGAEVATRVGPVWGLDREGELRNMWRPTPQRGLWFLAGGLYHCRIFSRYLALQLAAAVVGVPLGGGEASPRANIDSTSMSI